MTDRELAFVDAYMAFCKDRAPDYNEVGLAYFRAAWQASRKQMAEEAALEIELGKVALRFSDRAGDVCAEIDPADRICAEFYAAVSEVFERHYPSRRSLATPTEGKT